MGLKRTGIGIAVLLTGVAAFGACDPGTNPPKNDDPEESQPSARKTDSGRAAADEVQPKASAHISARGSTMPANPIPITADMSPRQMYVAYCGACHTLDLVESQRLDRNGWAWVMEDMVKKYGGAWINPREQEVLIDYLSERFGPG